MSEDYRESDRTLMNQVAELYSKGNIQIAEKHLDELDKSLSSWVAANPKNEKVAAAVAAVIYAVNVAVVPTHVVEIIPIGKVTKLTKAKSAIESTSTYKTFAAKSACTTSTVCFTAGTLIETKEGLKAIETFTGGELIWTRNDITLEYGYRPVVATKATPNQPIFQVTVKNQQGDIETLETTAEHPFWIKDTGWLKASLLEQGMILLDRNNQEVEVLSQYLLPNHTDTVYNIEVDDFHTYHVGRLGVWVHNADCCNLKYEAAPYYGNVGNTVKSKTPTVPVQTKNKPLFDRRGCCLNCKYKTPRIIPQ